MNLSETLYCKKHPRERGDYFCLSCRTIVCTLCIVNEHADHQATETTALLRQQQHDVQSLSDVLQSRSETLRKRLARLEALRQVSYTLSQNCQSDNTNYNNHDCRLSSKYCAKFLSGTNKLN